MKQARKMPPRKKKEITSGEAGDGEALIAPTLFSAMAEDESIMEPIMDDASNALNEILDLCYYEYVTGLCLGVCCLSSTPGVLEDAGGE